MKKATFQTPYEQYEEYNGLTFTVDGLADKATYDYEEVGELYYLITLENGEKIWAWPEEIFDMTENGEAAAP